MRKIILTSLALIAGLSIATASFAATPKKTVAAPKHEAVNTVKGKITAVNTAANQVTIEQDGSKVAVTITTSDAAFLKEGQHVKITLKAGTTDQAESVKVITHKKKK